MLHGHLDGKPFRITDDNSCNAVVVCLYALTPSTEWCPVLLLIVASCIWLDATDPS